MNRRNFIQTVGATMSASLLPVSGANLQVLEPKQPNIPMVMYRHWHPGVILKRVVELAQEHPGHWLSAHSYLKLSGPGWGFVSGGCSTGRMLRVVEHTADDIAAAVGIPVCLRGTDLSQIDPAVQLHHITRGQNIVACYAPGDKNVYWLAGTPFLVLFYVLPDKSRFIFKVGERKEDQPKLRLDTPEHQLEWADAYRVELRGTLAEMALNYPEVKVAKPGCVPYPAEHSLQTAHEQNITPTTFQDR